MGCGICARPSEGGIIMDHDLAIVMHDKLDESLIPFAKCRTGALRHLHEDSKGETIN